MAEEVVDLEIDDDNREEMHRHGVSVRIAFEVVDGDPWVVRNAGGERAKALLIPTRSNPPPTM